jgi:ATP-dependent Lon protease
MRIGIPGVVTGLAWTPTGGDILFIEASRVPGNGRLILTSQLGDVKKESAQAALSLVKGRIESLNLFQNIFKKSDIHIHVGVTLRPLITTIGSGPCLSRDAVNTSL